MTSHSSADEEIYEIFAIKYAENNRRVRRDNYLGVTDLHDAPLPMDFFVWVAKSKNRVILIDSGADQATCLQRGHDFLRCPVQSLSLLSVKPEDVDAVVVSHMHWDHMGNLEKIPNAKFYVHKSEVAFATGCGMCHPHLRRPYDVEQVCTLIKALYRDRVEFNGSDRQVAPGITIHHVGGHAPGLQIARVRTKRGYVVIASDAMHYYENAEMGNPFPVVVNVQEYLDAFPKIDEWADSPDHIVAGHDPIVMDIYPAFSESTKGIVARLDVAPADRKKVA